MTDGRLLEIASTAAAGLSIGVLVYYLFGPSAQKTSASRRKRRDSLQPPPSATHPIFRWVASAAVQSKVKPSESLESKAAEALRVGVPGV